MISDKGEELRATDTEKSALESSNDYMRSLEHEKLSVSNQIIEELTARLR